jgi:hypothetical protein
MKYHEKNVKVVNEERQGDRLDSTGSEQEQCYEIPGFIMKQAAYCKI